ncbi:hypothetical protein CH333_05775 [candidate division WOR-3 bacterium JGI_Cruoil_03_44_89]|uniref:Uncharacterized protein n=1 Tax=candidate division WOR-3 bacterium JGI_Cruoil_03_44_89 TaxID=1973748 RepID=A0A235BSX9_UNCW3|nr:MAG: hypothetical protein CH333_05775 [candidate division WOR-3 bacterium JGI_Cruoil_03_44_89]
MYKEKKIEALLAIGEDGKVVKVVKFYVKPRMVGARTRSTRFERTFDGSSYMLTLIAGEGMQSFERGAELGTPWVSINLSEEMDFSDKRLPNVLSSVVPELRVREQIQEQIISFANGE